MSAKRKPRPKRLERYPATGSTTDAPHTSRAVRGCACVCCAVHRRLERQAVRDQAMAAVADEVYAGSPVRCSENVTQEIRDVLGIK